MGNRQLANQNTEDIFRNRNAIAAAINVDPSNQVLYYYFLCLYIHHHSIMCIRRLKSTSKRLERI